MRRDLVESAALIEHLTREIMRPRLLVVVAEFVIHARVEEVVRRMQLPEAAPSNLRGFDLAAGPCTCCGSTTACIIERIPDQRLLIDRITGARVHEDDVVADSRAEFEDLVAGAQVVPLVWRCTEQQLPLLREGDEKTRKVIAALGGSRSGKTQIGVQWLLRRWMRRGGAERTFWFVAPSLAQSWIAMSKLVHGEGDSPPVLPVDADGQPLLARAWPASKRSSDLAVTLIDGTRIEMHHARDRTGKSQKGFDVVDALVDEACEVDHADTWSVIVSRTTKSHGCVYAATTPKPGHFLRALVVDQAERTEEDGSKVGNPLFVSYSLSKRGNVWFDAAAIEADIAAMPNDSVRQREGEGLWIEDGVGALYLEFERARHVAYDPVWSLADLGRGERDVTPAAVSRLFVGDSPYVVGRRPATRAYIGGSDVNVEPFVTVVGQVEQIDPKDPHNPEKWRLWIWDEVVSRKSTSQRQATLIQSHDRSAQFMGLAVSPYKGLPVLIDPSACYSDPTRKRLAKPGQASRSPCAAATMTEAGLDVRSCNLSDDGQPIAPRIRDRVNLLHTLMRTDRLRVHNRCTEVLRSLTQQQNDGTGAPVKEPGEASDRLSAAADALGYLAWGLFAFKPKRRSAGWNVS